MTTKLISKASIKVADLDINKLDFSAVFDLSGEQTTNGITYSIKAAENTITGKGVAARGVLGPYVELSKVTGTKYGKLTSTLAYNTSAKGFIAKLAHAYNKTLLDAEYSDVTKQTTLGATVVPHPANKLQASYNATKKTSKAKHTLVVPNFKLVTNYVLAPAQPPSFEATQLLPGSYGSLTASHSLQSGASALEHTSKPLPKVGGTLTTAYALNGGQIALSWAKGLCTWGAVTRWDGKGLSKPTLSLTVEQTYTDLTRGRSLPGFGGSQSQEAAPQKPVPSARAGSGAAAAAVDPDTEARLKKIDQVYQAELARLGQQHSVDKYQAKHR